MPFESHLPQERINVRRLTTEQPENQWELSFDLDKAITDKDWVEMRDYIIDSLDTQDTRIHLMPELDEQEMFLSMYMLSPDKFKELFYVSGQLPREPIERALQVTEEDKNEEFFMDRLATAQLITPEKVQDLVDDQTTKESMRELLASDRKRDFIELARRAVKMKMIFPTEDITEFCDDVVRDRLQKRIALLQEGEFWTRAAIEMYYFKVLYPEKFKRVTPNQEAWERMKLMLGELRKNNEWPSFAGLAMSMKVLAAEEVKFTDRGFEVVMHKPKINQTAPPSPERRKF